jgi:hypothetical protein
MMQKFFNNWSTTITTALGVEDNQFAVPLAAAQLLKLGNGDFCQLTLKSDSATEIVKVAFIQENMLYLDSRGEESTTVSAWPAGSKVMCSLTAGALEALLYAAARPALVQGQDGDTLSIRAGDVARVRANSNTATKIKLLEEGPFTVELICDATSPRVTFIDSYGEKVTSGAVNNVPENDSSAAFKWEVIGDYGFSLYPKGVSTIYLAGIFNYGDLILYQIYGKGQDASGGGGLGVGG